VKSARRERGESSPILVIPMSMIDNKVVGSTSAGALI
jgi:hypothetical protein